MNIEISNICNLQCSFCPEVERAKHFMEVAFFYEIIQQLKPYTKLVAFHLMGEPLLHPQFKEFVSICSENGMRIFLVTNGVLLDEGKFECLLQPALRQVSFSLHSFRDNFPNRDLGPYLEKIFQFTELAFLKRKTMFINYRLWNLSDSRGREALNLEILDRIEKRFQVPVPREVDVLNRKNHVLKNYLSLHFDTEFAWPAMSLPVIGEWGTCYGLQSHFGILVDGTVVPCCLDKEGDIALGNLRSQNLKDILQSNRATKLVDGFKKNQLVEALCQRCQYINRFNMTLR